MELSLPTATEPAATNELAQTGVTSGTEPADTSTPHVDVVEAKQAKDEEINLTLWAKTNKQAREFKAKAELLEKQVADLSKKLEANPDEQTARQAALTEAMKAPGAAKKLLEAGWTFDRIVAELTDIPVEDPALKAATDRLEQVEKALAAKDEADKKAKNEQLTATQKAHAEKARGEIASFVKSNGDAIVEAETDPRAGTPRWAIVSTRPDLHEEARVAVTEYIQAKHPQGVTNEQAEALVNQALDQLELAERKKLEPVLNKLGQSKPVRTFSKPSDQADRVTPTSDQFLASLDKQSIKPRTITNGMSGPLPTGTKPKGRYQGGPRQITYSD